VQTKNIKHASAARIYTVNLLLNQISESEKRWLAITLGWENYRGMSQCKLAAGISAVFIHRHFVDL
jgi:hypothetical protein